MLTRDNTKPHCPNGKIEGNIVRVTNIKGVSFAPDPTIVHISKISDVEAKQWRQALGIEKR
jgi:hypothetical protein